MVTEKEKPALPTLTSDELKSGYEYINTHRKKFMLELLSKETNVRRVAVLMSGLAGCFRTTASSEGFEGDIPPVKNPPMFYFIPDTNLSEWKRRYAAVMAPPKAAEVRLAPKSAPAPSKLSADETAYQDWLKKNRRQKT